MIAYNDPLWQALQAFELDGANAELSFTKRLARENGWHHAYAEQVVVEYKKFLWLAMRAGHPVTPSDEVDQAWHLHLVYTESYWEDLCGKVLGRPLHHGPTKGGANEDAKYHDWYARTLASYEAAFGSRPPASVWPPPEARFDTHARFRRVDTGDHWVISKNLWRPRLWKAAAAVAAMGLVLAVALQAPRATDLVPVKSAEIFWLVFIVVMVVIVISNIAKNRRGGGSGGNGCSSIGSGCSSGAGGGCGSSHGHSHHDGHSGSGHDSSGCGSGSSGCSSSGCGGGGCGGGGD
jgi:hypothetical protein